MSINRRNLSVRELVVIDQLRADGVWWKFIAEGFERDMKTIRNNYKAWKAGDYEPINDVFEEWHMPAVQRRMKHVQRLAAAKLAQPEGPGGRR